MSSRGGPAHGLPDTSGVPHPARGFLHLARPLAARIVHHRWHIEIDGAERFPSGPAVVVANHIGFVDGPLMAIVGPRPVHALTKREMFTGPLGLFLRGAGQIPVHRDDTDPRAVKTALRVLRDGGVVGVFPEGTRGAGELVTARRGAAYLALATGAAIVPLVFLGTREPGGSNNSIPPKGRRFVLSYGEPVGVTQTGWPRRRDDVGRLTEQVRVRLRRTLDDARARTGLELPGPIPEKDADE